MQILRPTLAEIDLNALKDNARKLRADAAGKSFLFVTKANAYGHGAAELAKFMQKENLADMLGTASIEEGILLRKAGVTLPVLVLGSIYPFESFETAINNDLSVTVASMQAAQALIDTAARLGKKAKAHIKQDSGMGRIGVRRTGAADVAQLLHTSPHVELEGIYSHLSCAWERGHEYTARQTGFFNDALKEIEKRSLPVKYKHISATYGIYNVDNSAYNMVRAGLGVYGLAPGFKPVLTLKSKIVFIKDIEADYALSYDRSFISRAPMRVATIPIGYGDGYLRALSGKADALVGGKRCKILGNITMDMVMIDITDVRGAQSGSEVVLIGAQGGQEITAGELALKAGTIPYEITTLITERVPRVYK